MMVLLLCLSATLAASLAAAQTATPQAEIRTHESPVTFKTNVRLVSVPVVVRDRQGRAVGNLTKDDFQLFEGGRQQIISRFSVDHLEGAATAPPAHPTDANSAKAKLEAASWPTSSTTFT